MKRYQSMVLLLSSIVLLFSGTMVNRSDDAEDADNGAGWSGSCSFQSGDMCGYTIISTNDRLGWDLIGEELIHDYVQYIGNNTYTGTLDLFM